ncbi:MAG: radical SAM protein [Bacteroidales bacterium]|nr:radical SAM protein [Bacteroidales bacterium]
MIDKKFIKEYNEANNRKKLKYVCYAPFTSLRFSQSGNILACCYNRGYSLGKYPNTSIKEAWSGDKIKALRNHLKKQEFDLGCDICESRIENKLYNLTGAFHYDYLHEELKKRYPVMFDFELDNTCNLECVMCSGENSSKILINREKLKKNNSVYDENFLLQLKDFIPHLVEARFSGGEPFLIPIYYKIWELFAEINPSTRITVLTNATIFNERIANLLKRANFSIAVSIDSLKKDTYSKIRKNADFDVVIKNMKIFYEYSKQNNSIFFINVCPMPYNWFEIPDILTYCNSRNIRLVFHTIIFPPQESLWILSSKKLGKIHKYYSSIKLSSKSDCERQNNLAFHNLKTQVQNLEKSAIYRESKLASISKLTLEDTIVVFKNYLGEKNEIEFKTIISLLDNPSISTFEFATILKNLLSFPREIIISELKHNSIDRFFIKLKMFNYQQ